MNQRLAAAGAGAVKADTQAKDVVRLAFLSHDPMARFYPVAVPMAWHHRRQEGADYAAELEGARAAARAAAKAERRDSSLGDYKPPGGAQGKTPPKRPAGGYSERDIDWSAAEFLGCQGGFGQGGYNGWLGMLGRLESLGFTTAEMAAICAINPQHKDCGREDIIAAKIAAGLPGIRNAESERNSLRGEAVNAGWIQPGRAAGKSKQSANTAAGDKSSEETRDPDRQLAGADAHRILIRLQGNYRVYQDPEQGGRLGIALLHPKFRTWAPMYQSDRHTAAPLVSMIRKARGLSGGSEKFNPDDDNADHAAHYLAVHKTLIDLVNDGRFENHRPGDIPMTETPPISFGADSRVVVWSDYSGGIDLSTGAELTPDEVEAAYIESPPWGAIRKPDWSDYRRTLAEDYIPPLRIETVMQDGEEMLDVTPLPGGNGADIAKWIVDRLPGFIETNAWLIQEQQRVAAGVYAQESAVGKSTAAELVSKSLQKGGAYRQARDVLKNSRFNPFERLLSQHILLFLDEIQQVEKPPKGVFNNALASGWDVEEKYQVQAERQRSANLVLLGSAEGPNVDFAQQGVAQRLSVELFYQGLEPVSRTTRNRVLDRRDNAASDWMLCALIDAIRQGNAAPPETAYAAAKERAEHDPLIEELQQIFQYAEGEFCDAKVFRSRFQMAEAAAGVKAIAPNERRNKLTAALRHQGARGFVERQRMVDGKRSWVIPNLRITADHPDDLDGGAP